MNYTQIKSLSSKKLKAFTEENSIQRICLNTLLALKELLIVDMTLMGVMFGVLAEMPNPALNSETDPKRLHAKNN
ncbi:MAG: hypothetical protein PVI77_22840 [Desulfobacterales bacterium]|jgi:hypothetical protein